MRMKDMAQNNSLSGTMDREAIKIRGDAHRQNCLSDNGITIKTTWPFFKK